MINWWKQVPYSHLSIKNRNLKFSAGSLVTFLCFSNNVTPSQEWENACILVKFWKFMFFCFENLKLWTVKLLDFSGGIYMVKHFLVRLQMQYLEQRVIKILSLIFQIISIINSEAATQSVLRKRCSENMQQIYRRTPMPKCDSNKVAKQLYWNHTSEWMFSCKFAACF